MGRKVVSRVLHSMMRDVGERGISREFSRNESANYGPAWCLLCPRGGSRGRTHRNSRDV